MNKRVRCSSWRAVFDRHERRVVRGFVGAKVHGWPLMTNHEIMTVGQPITIVEGGPTHTHISPTRAAGIPAINTSGLPGPIIGPPTWGIGGTPGVTIGQTCMSVRRAAGIPPIRTVGAPGPVIVPPCAVGSPTRAAGGIVYLLSCLTLCSRYIVIIQQISESGNNPQRCHV